jgi:hypothetical protein
MNRGLAVSTALAVTAVAALCVSPARAVNLAISIGVRETGTSAPIGGDGGTNNSIEWINRDGLTLPLDGVFHTFTFNFGTDPVNFFAGTQPPGGAPNVLDGTRGTLEHVRIRNIDGLTVPIQLYIDNIRNTTALAGPVNVSNFEGFAIGTEVTFQEPTFSGSTSANIATTPNIAAVTTTAASEGTQSDGIQFRFIDADGTRWLRLTTNAATNLPNPAIDFASGSTLSFDVRGVPIPEPGGVALVALAAAAATRRARR